MWIFTCLKGVSFKIHTVMPYRLVEVSYPPVFPRAGIKGTGTTCPT